MKAYTKEQIESLLALETEYDDDFDHGWNMAIRTILKGVDLVDMEPVIRCKDCKWYKTNYSWSGREYKVCVREAYEPMREDEDFCSRGERRDEDEND